MILSVLCIARSFGCLCCAYYKLFFLFHFSPSFFFCFLLLFSKYFCSSLFLRAHFFFVSVYCMKSIRFWRCMRKFYSFTRRIQHNHMDYCWYFFHSSLFTYSPAAFFGYIFKCLFLPFMLQLAMCIEWVLVVRVLFFGGFLALRFSVSCLFRAINEAEPSTLNATKKRTLKTSELHAMVGFIRMEFENSCLLPVFDVQ